MNLLSEILLYITETLGALYLVAIILRFFLQLARADFYNPFSQTLVKVTNPALIPIRRVIPGVLGIDAAAIVLALLVQVILGEANYFIVYQSFFNPLSAILFGILGILKITTYLVFATIIILVISSFLAPHSSHPVIMLARQLLEPLMAPIQRLLPPMGGLDFSVLFIGMGNVILQKVLDATAWGMNLHNPPLTFLVIGY
ncbi:YggT family protein [Agarilytica rhodophyticola]|uniref:YggT family protein n=1 Tax=Agarilytica rhodophyticola TaxID=1737490 RepID=UPI000B342DB6|nr:YggT family protein [Agarilytica rhodophyticola]